MKKPDDTLSAWRAVEPRMVPLAKVCKDEGLQPRALDIAPVKARARLEELSEEHVSRMRADLDAHAANELEPILLAEVEGKLVIVDGHHRHRAYKRAKREAIPARVLTLSRHEAALVSKLVNASGVKLPMHKANAAEAAWQYLAHVTTQGRQPRPLGDDFRSLEGRFGVSKSTLARMVKHLPSVRREQYAAPALDLVTRWPRWTYVKGNAVLGRFAEVSPEDRRTAEIERTAKRLAKLREDAGTWIFREAAALLLDEDHAEELDTLAELAGIPAGDY